MRGQRRTHEIEGQNHDLITFFLLVSVHKLQQKCVVLGLVFIMCVVILICCVCACHLSTGKHGTWLWTSASLSCLPSLRKAPPSEYVCVGLWECVKDEDLLSFPSKVQKHACEEECVWRSVVHGCVEGWLFCCLLSAMDACKQSLQVLHDQQTDTHSQWMLDVECNGNTLTDDICVRFSFRARG